MARPAVLRCAIPLTADETRLLRRSLLVKGKELADLLAEVIAGKSPSGADALTAQPGETKEEKLRRYLGVIQSRIDATFAGTYGRCDECGEDIPLVELSELPWADRCGRCAS